MNFAEQQAKRAGRNKIAWLTVWLLLAAIIALAIFVVGKPFAPAKRFSSAQDLRDLYDAGDTWVTRDVYYLFWTGGSYYTYDEDNPATTQRVRAWWYAFNANMLGEPQAILVKLPVRYLKNEDDIAHHEYMSFTVRGTARECDFEEWRNLYVPYIDSIYEEEGNEYTRSEIEDWFRTDMFQSPILIDMTETRLESQISFCVFAALALLAVFLLVRAVRAMQNYTDTKDYLRLGGGDPEKAAAANLQLGEEFDNPILVLHKSARLTAHWAIQTSAFGYKVFPKEDLLWMYQHIVQQRTYGIPVSKTYSIKLCFADPKIVFQIPAKNEAGAVGLMEQIYAYKPDIIVGFHAEAHGAYRALVAERGK